MAIPADVNMPSDGGWYAWTTDARTPSLRTSASAARTAAAEAFE